MSMIDSIWFLNKLKTAAHMPYAKKPAPKQSEQNLLGIFDIATAALADMHQAENTETQMVASVRDELLAHLSQQAREAGLKVPELIAQQIYLMASNAYAQQQANPESRALHHAKEAALALIQVQRRPAWLRTSKQYLSAKPVTYTWAASLLASVCIGMAIAYQALHPNVSISNAYLAQAQETMTTPDSNLASPADTAEMYARIEKMRDGRCHYIEALQLPEAQQGLYLQNVIAGQVSNKVSEQKVARELMEKVSCDYTPMLMKNSAG